MKNKTTPSSSTDAGRLTLDGAIGSAGIIESGELDVPAWNCKIPFTVHELCVYVDTTGIGAMVADRLEACGMPVSRITRVEALKLRKERMVGS